MKLAGEILTSASPQADLEGRLRDHEKRIIDTLAPYEAITAMCWWLDAIRAIEEVINLPLVDWLGDDFEHYLFSTPLKELIERPRRLVVVRTRLQARFGETFGNRISNLIVQSWAIADSFAKHGLLEPAAGLQSLGHMVGYFQSRRRHFVGLLHLMVSACMGHRSVAQMDALNIFLPIIELEGMNLMGAQNCLIEKLSREKLKIQASEGADLKMLDGFFLEPERARITDMDLTDAAKGILAAREPQPEDKLFSAAELRNDIVLIRAAFGEFDLANTDFEPGAALIDRLSKEFIDRDFWVVITPQQLKSLFQELNSPKSLQMAILNTSTTYMECLSTYSPFILIDGTYRSTVSLLSRFIYYWRARTLNSHKRFQIRAGFIFERAVGSALADQGFIVQDITRINRSEFDVVTLRDGVIWNVQCKNNFIDLERVEHDALRFARYNRLLVRNYEKALAKEKAREYLLAGRLDANKIQHMVVSKFPVITNNAHIIPFSRIKTFSARADTILSKL